MHTLTHRYKAWLTLEADSPLSIGSGRESLTTDRLVARNAAGSPYIPGTGLAGALRAAMKDALNRADFLSIFGFSENELGNSEKKQRKNSREPTSLGSRIVINSAHLLSRDGKMVMEGLPVVTGNDEYIQHLNTLPERDHVRINERGTAADKSKFDEQVCYKGVRFVGSLELLGTKADEGNWQQILNQFASPFFRIGGGTRKGFGKLKIVKIQTRMYDLNQAQSRTAYLVDDNSLQLPAGATETNVTAPEASKYKRYLLELKPRDFFFLGAGFGDDEADDVYKTEKVIDWSDGSAKISEDHILIPATSVKGALRHRLAFHYNKETEQFIEEDESDESLLLERQLKELEMMAEMPEGIDLNDGWWEQTMQQISEATFEPAGRHIKGETDATSKNKAVRTLFGYAADDTVKEQEKGKRGNVLFSDVYLRKAKEKVFDHVRIDRFTGGASDGALFQEKTVFTQETFSLELLVAAAALEQDTAIEKAWHATLKDLCEGHLPLGGKTTKGHGFFTGECNVNLKNER